MDSKIVCMKASVAFVILVGLTVNVESQSEPLQWDELIFTQEWGYSACLQFKDAPGHSDKTCRFEEQPAIWSIHGIWPTKAGTKGPGFCSKVTFDISKLEPIMSGLKEFWYEIDGSKEANHFWEHEWVKHGSCAKELDTFSTELKYFQGALTLREKMDLFAVLKTGGGIIPRASKGYSLDEMHTALKTGLKTDSAVPYLQCLKTKNSANEVEYHLLQVEICLDRNLQIVDCTKRPRPQGVTEKGGPRDQAMPCPHDQPILYQDYLPKSKRYDWKKPSFVKNLPMSSKYWKKFLHSKKHQPTHNNIHY